MLQIKYMSTKTGTMFKGINKHKYRELNRKPSCIS